MSRRRGRPIRNKGVLAAARHQQRPSSGERLTFRVDPFTRRVVRPLLIAALATSVAIAILVIVRLITPEYPWLGIVPLAFLAAVEGTYTAAWLNNPDSHGVDRGIYRVAEVLILLVVARVYSWILFGQGIPSPDEMRLFLTAPVGLLTTAGFVMTTTVTLIAWWIGMSVSKQFAQLDVSIYETGFFTLSQAEQKAKADDRPIQVARGELQDQYFKTWLSVGMVMIILAALSTYEVDQLASVVNPFEVTRLGLGPAMLLALMIYFLAGLWLLSHARLLRMNARWLLDGVAKDTSLERGWQRSALLVLVSIAVIALFLPIGSTLAISRILTIGLSGFAYLSSLIFSFFGYLFASALLILTRNAEEAAVRPPELFPAPMEQPQVPPSVPNPLITMVISSAFWALLIAFVIASFLFFLRERGYRVDMGQVRNNWATVTQWLRASWARLTGRVRRVNRDLRARMRAAGADEVVRESPLLSRPRFVRLNALSPRDQVRYFYLALVRRAGEHGVKRRDSQTPLEYGHNLQEVWPEAEGDLQELTNAFLEARYSSQPMDRNEAKTIRERWNRLKAHLRMRK